MIRKKIPDDITLQDEWDKGDPIIFCNPEIRRMLKLANAGKDDIFYDLGCGWGQNLIIALTEFYVKKAIGIEHDRERVKKAKNRLKDNSLAGKGKIVHAEFEKLYTQKVNEADLAEATIVFYGLGNDRSDFIGLRKRLKRGCRLVYYYNCLFPEILADDRDFPFFLSIVPFRKPKSQHEWLSSIINKEKSIFNKQKKPNTKELWDELTHDYDTLGYRDDIKDYKQRLEQILKTR